MVPRMEKVSNGKEEKTIRPCMLPKGAIKGSTQKLAGSRGEDSAMKKDWKGKRRQERPKSIENHGARKKAGESNPGSSMEPWDSRTKKVAQG